jgi:hypothetical protein
MAQNTSHAVMSQRIEAHDSLVYFLTPPWATRALCEWLEVQQEQLALRTAWEPACGECDMARPLAEYFKSVEASDIKDYSIHRGKEQTRVGDFLLTWEHPPHHRQAPRDWVITNPPFRLGEQFARTALSVAKRGVALLVRTAFLESAERFRSLYSETPPTDILQFVERVPMFKGRLDKGGSTATAYCWLVWRKPSPYRTQFHWLAPCRKALERPGDYD